MTMYKIDNFCGGSEFWNSTRLSKSSYPEFTECFQHTILVWVPSAFLWLTLPVFILHLRFMVDPRPLPLGKLSICKTVLCVSLAILALVDLSPQINSQLPITASFIVSTVVKFITFILAGILCQVSRRFGLPSPCLLYLFWLFYIVAKVIPFYTLIVQKVYEEDLIKFVLFYINYGMLILQLVLHSFSEATVVHNEKYKEPCPMQAASFPSKIFFMWANRLIVKGYKKPIKDEEVFDLPEEFKSKNQAPPFLEAWDKKLQEERRKHNTAKVNSHQNSHLKGDIPLLSTGERRHRTINHPAVALFLVLVKTYWFPLFKLNALRVISDLMTFINPLLLKIMITYTENRATESEWKGYVYVAGFSLVSFTTSAIYNQSFISSLNLAMNIKSALVAAVYRKSLTMNSDARKKFTVGAIVNLMSVDCQRLSEIVLSLWMLWSCPLQICIALYLLHQTLGVSFVAGLGVILMVIPLNSVLSTATKKIHSQLLTIKDSRLKITNEVLNGIKVLKLFAWEESFEEKIMKIRRKEIILLTKAALLNAVNIFCWIGVPVLVTLATFVMYILMSENQHLDAGTAFVALSLFNILRVPINQLPLCISALINAQVSLGRLGKYLSGSDLDEKNCGHDQNTENAVEIRDGTFTWDRDMPSSLKNINMRVKEGELVAIVGGVGAGKSSLLSAILGEMDKLQGQVNIKGSIAYVPQQAWIQNLSLRQNILFGGDVTKDYWQILKDCALDSDLKVLPGGESTEIGERGINLSGGQKQRVSLSRSVYSNKDIYLLDDPLSAVDTHVGKHIFKHVIGKQSVLKDKTRILVTHGVHWLPLVDRIIVIDQGQITEVGSYEELLTHDGPFAQFVKTYMINDEKEAPAELLKTMSLLRLNSTTSAVSCQTTDGESIVDANSVDNLVEIEGLPPQEENIGSITSVHDIGELVEEEFVEEGKIRFKVLKSYLRHFGIQISLVTLVLFLLAQCSSVGSNIWLGIWTDDSNQSGNSSKEEHHRNETSNSFYYLGIFSVLSVVQALASFGYIAVLFFNMVKVSGIMFANLLGNILRQPMSFFDTTPSGRIMNRFTKDVDILDTGLNHIFRLFMHSLFTVMSIIVVITLSTPWFLAPAVPIFIVYYIIQRFYIPTSRQLRRNESIARSPLYSHFTETITGASSIRAYSMVDRFREQSQDRMDKNNALHFASSVISRWLRMRLELIGNITVLSASLLAVLMPDVTASDVGLSITYALQVTSMLNQMVSVSSQLEVNVVSVERIVEYTNREQEADWYIKETKPKDTWPDEGEIELNNLQTKYRPDLPLVLKGLTANFKSGEKIGIVGRTGAGKSSLSMALFRIIESAGGSITIDGVDIAKLGLHDLRSNLTILPQDPILFTGSLRMNLDPFEEHGDEVLWTALEHAHLKTFVSGLPEGLNYECDEGGNNLSVGQRQLLCLARSLLRKTKILVLDEATAAVDMETDDLIQKTIRSEFEDSTVLSIAHRLNTVLDYDKILVLDNGEITEFDSPQTLLQDDCSVFYSMAKDAKLVT